MLNFYFQTFEEHMAQYTMHDLVHDLATLVMADELIASDVASKSNNKHGKKYCRYALVTKYDQADNKIIMYFALQG
jgi:hypothetical protein